MKFLTNGLIAIGIFLGILIVLVFEFLTDFFGALISIPSELFAALLGAGIALLGTLFTIYAANEERQDKRIENDEALMLVVLVKMQKMTNNFFHFRKHIEDCYNMADPKSHINPGFFVLALAGHPSPVEFSPEEKAAFIRWGATELSNQVSEMDGIHNSLISAFETYAELRQKLFSTLPASMEGMVGRTSFSEEEFAAVAPKFAELHDLARQLREQSLEDYPYAVKITNNLMVLIKERTSFDFELKFAE